MRRLCASLRGVVAMARRRELRLGLADAPVEEAYVNLLRAVDRGRVTAETAVLLRKLLEGRLVMVDAAQWRAKLEAAERTLEQNAQDSARPLPAYRLKRLPAAKPPEPPQ